MERWFRICNDGSSYVKLSPAPSIGKGKGIKTGGYASVPSVNDNLNVRRVPSLLSSTTSVSNNDSMSQYLDNVDFTLESTANAAT